MARTPFNARITNSSGYSVPAGKYAVFSMSLINAASSGPGFATAFIGGQAVGRLSAAITPVLKPLTAASGHNVSLSVSEGSFEAGISGFLYDNV